MVYLSSIAVAALALPLVAQAIQQEQQIPLQANKIHLKKGPLDHAHSLLRHHPLIDTHNDLPM